MHADMHRLHVFGMVCLWYRWPADKDCYRQHPGRVHRHPIYSTCADTILYLCPTDMHFLHLQCVGRMPVRRHTDKDGVDELACGLYRWDASNYTELHYSTAMHFLHLQCVGRMPVRRHTDKDGVDELACGLYRWDASNYTELHYSTAS